MMNSNPGGAYRVRFRGNLSIAADAHVSAPGGSPDPGAREPGPPAPKRSRYGCKECRRRRVKCDEAFPVCDRCRRRGSHCHPRARPPSSEWRYEVDLLAAYALSDPLGNIPYVNKAQLQAWLDSTSQLLALRPDLHANPLSLPILQHVSASRALVHACQCVSIGHTNSFDRSASSLFLHERQLALEMVRKELAEPKTPRIALFLSVFIIGISSPWILDDRAEFGSNHLLGARAIIDSLLRDASIRSDPWFPVVLGYYLWWDMGAAFFLDPDERSPLDMAEVYRALQKSNMQPRCHPIAAYHGEVLYLLGVLARYCRRALDSGTYDTALEDTIEDQLMRWQPVGLDGDVNVLSNAFCKHGLIMLCTVRRWRFERSAEYLEGGHPDIPIMDMTSRLYALEIIPDLLEIPASVAVSGFQGIPLVTAAAELTADDEGLREEIRSRFEAMFSRTRVTDTLWALQLIEEVWALNDRGCRASYLEVMLRKRWHISQV